MEGLTTGCDAGEEESVALILVFFPLIANNEADIDDSTGHPGLRKS